ncbi:MAG: hypothetical protein JWR26_1725 [Pedosphaera sp.]|nr:hypothetical protein [Pedosphaera sp.]
MFAMALALPGRADTSVFPKGTNLSSIVVIGSGSLTSAAQQTLIATLQGIVARKSASQIYIDGGGGYTLWRNHLASAYGIPVTTTSNPWSLVTQYRSLVSGYILFDLSANTNSVNAATSLCGPLNAIAVDASIEASVRAAGVTNLLLDVRTRDEAWVWTNYNAVLSRSTVIEQKETFGDQLRDYATLAGAFTFYDGNSAFRTSIMSAMNPDSACLGWGDASQGESVFVSSGSQHAVYTIAADWALDLSTLSSVRDPNLYQRTYNLPVSETNVHYVTFLVTDGDNVQWNLGDFPAYFNNSARGGFNMGWALSPSLADLAPSVLRWYYDNSSNGPNRDFFVAGPSGIGYMYPSMYPAADLDIHAQKLNDFMTRADLNVAQIIDFNSFTNTGLWNKYFAQPAIDSLIYLDYSNYAAKQGALYFSTNGKSMISPSDVLWSGVEEETNVIAKMNAAPRDPSSPAGYSLVLVHVWSKNLGNVQTVVAGLASDVRVVTPDQYVKLIRDNIGRKLSYDFAISAQGWAGNNAGGQYDKSYWTNNVGNPTGALLMDGSDLGHSNSTPNAWFTRQIILPPNVTTISFDTRANNDGLLRLRVQRPDGNFATLLDWEKLTDQNWVSRSASLTNFSGQTVTIYFEQNDGGQGSGEYRYVDNVVMHTTGTPLYLPAAPKLLTVNAGNSTSLLWRDNDINEAGFKVERSLGTNGVWNEIASVSSNVTTFTDALVIPSTNYSYRVRSWNTQGFSPYSNTRNVTSPPRPSVAVAVSAGTLTLTWPAWATNFNLYATANLQPSAIWLPVTNSVSPSGTNSTVTLPVAPGQRFFQLRSP